MGIHTPSRPSVASWPALVRRLLLLSWRCRSWTAHYRRHTLNPEEQPGGHIADTRTPSLKMRRNAAKRKDAAWHMRATMPIAPQTQKPGDSLLSEARLF